MTLRPRLFAALTSALVGALVAGLLVLSPAPATALGPDRPGERTKADQVLGGRGPDAVFERSSYLCYGYRDCRAKGMGNAGYAQKSGTMYWRMYAGHNCTNYAAYRMVRSGLPNERPWSGGGNATYWGTSMPRITDDVPRVGAVTWWKANTGPAGSSGHVAYVEKVVSQDEIIISQDSWGGDFSWAVVTRSSGNWPSGFIHFNDVPLTNRAAPVVDGVAKVGSVLSSSAGSWKPGAVNVDYQWYADGKKITRATTKTFRLTRARLGQKISVRTTASKLGYPTRTASSAATEAVLPGQLSSQTAPRLSGQAKVDSTLTLDTGAWTPKPDALRVQWLADGQPIEGVRDGATTLTLTPDLVDAAISATVTATREGYEPVSATTATTERVAPGTFRITTPPSVRGSAKLGETLTLGAGAHQPSDARVTTQWLRDGEPVLNATGPTYRITNLDLGARISARVTLSRPGYTSATADSPATPVVRTDPKLRLQVERGKGRLKLTVTVTAPGVDTVTGPLVLRYGGVAQEATLRGGVAKVRLTGLPSGKRTLTIRYAGSTVVNRLIATREVRVR